MYVLDIFVLSVCGLISHLRVKNVCIGYLCFVCLWSNQPELMALFIVLIYGLVQVFYLSFIVNF